MDRGGWKPACWRNPRVGKTAWYNPEELPVEGNGIDSDLSQIYIKDGKIKLSMVTTAELEPVEKPEKVETETGKNWKNPNLKSGRNCVRNKIIYMKK